MLKHVNVKYNWIPVCICVVLFLAGCSCDGSQAEKTKGKNDISGKVTSQTANPEPDNVTLDGLSAEEEEAEVLPDSADSEQEADIREPLAKELPFTAGDDKICAVVYLGRGEQQTEQLEIFRGRYAPDYPVEGLETVEMMGEEAYLIIPRYEQSEISLNVLEQKDDGTIQVTTDAAHPDGAFIVHCNPLAQFANVEINIAYNGQVHVIVPVLSALDGHLEEMQVVLDLTDESVY